MSDQIEPLVYPSRNLYPYNPGVPDRQLWAIGMIIVQWSMTETLIDQQIRSLIGGDSILALEYQKQRNFQSRMNFWQTQIEKRFEEPLRSEALGLLQSIRNLSSQRDEVVHRLWGGGMQAGSWSAEDLETTDAALLRKAGDSAKKTKSTDARNTISWRMTFGRLRQMAREMATLNRDLFKTFILPRE